MDNLQKESKLFKGYWRKTQWVEHALLERMAKAWIKDALNNGCRSWDMRLARLLSVVLVSALNRRSGDIAQSYRYKGAKYLTWADVTLKLERGPEIKNLVAKFTLRHTKGFKWVVSTNSFYNRPDSL
ncbi:MAG: hypothetical protein M1832_002321 [Thelocarpon impressellum]|nr:MAG: hypothetical protein M1832_002321 [Thelocarpon impressellum]